MIFVQTLGTSLIRAGSRRYTPSSARAFATLFYLSANGGRRVPRERLHSLIYPRQTEHNAAHSVRQLLYRLRGAGVDLDGDAESVSIPSEAVAADYTEIIAADRPTAEQIAKIRQGLLPGYDPAHSEEYAEWYEAHRAEISTKLQLRLLQELARSKRVGDWTAAERCARACMALDPLNYEANCGLAEAVAGAGSKSLALDLLDDFMKELGESPADLKRPAAILRKRISEKMPAVTYRSRLDLPFIGREQEMLQLSEAFQRARRGEAQCVVLSGEAGIGKTRIAAEFKTVAVLEGARVERVVAQPQDSHRPMGAFIDLVPLLLQLPGALGCSPASMAALRRLTKQTGSVDEAPSEATKNSEALFYSITCAISDLVDAIAGEAPLVVVVEDAHWLDAMSLRVLSDLVSERKERRLMVMVTTRHREKFLQATPESDRVFNVRVGRLEPESATSLVDAALRDCRADVSTELSEWMCRTAAGHPLFTSLLALHYDHTRVPFSLPQTITTLLEQRIAGVSAKASDVLRTCAILGRYCNSDRVVRTLDVPLLELLQLLRELEICGLVTSDKGIEITHPLVAEAVLRGANSPGSALLFGRIASILEEEASSSGAVAQIWDCASLWVEAAQPMRALAVLRRCARHALEMGRPLEAAETLVRALALVQESEERNSVARELIRSAHAARDKDLVLQGASVLGPSVAEPLHDDVELAAILCTTWAGDDVGTASEGLINCCTGEGVSDDHRLEAATTLAWLVDDTLLPRTHQSLECLSRVADQARNNREALSTLWFLTVYHAAFGDLDQAAETASRLLDVAAGIPSSAAAPVQVNAALALWRAGHDRESFAAFEAGFLSAWRSGATTLQVTAASSLASNYHDVGRDEERDRWMEEATRIANSMRTVSLFYATCAVDFALQNGEISRAKDLIRKVQAATPRSPAADSNRWFEVCRLRILKLESDYRLTASDFERLSRYRSPGLDHGAAGDFEVEFAAAELIDRGEPDKARSLVERFLTVERRGRSPLRRGLRELIQTRGWG